MQANGSCHLRRGLGIPINSKTSPRAIPRQQTPKNGCPRRTRLTVTSIYKILVFVNLYEESFFVVSHVVYSGRERRLMGRHSNGVDGEVLHEKLVLCQTTVRDHDVDRRSKFRGVQSSRAKFTYEILQYILANRPRQTAMKVERCVHNRQQV